MRRVQGVDAARQSMVLPLLAVVLIMGTALGSVLSLLAVVCPAGTDRGAVCGGVTVKNQTRLEQMQPEGGQ